MVQVRAEQWAVTLGGLLTLSPPQGAGKELAAAGGVQAQALGREPLRRPAAKGSLSAAPRIMAAQGGHRRIHELAAQTW